MTDRKPRMTSPIGRATGCCTLAVAAVCAARPALAAAARWTGGLPAGAIVAFTPATDCGKLAGGWRDFKDADGRVVVGASPATPAASPALAPAQLAGYWAKGTTLKPDMVPRSPVTGGGQVLVTTPTLNLRKDTSPALAAAFASATPDTRLFGYAIPAPADHGSETLAVGYGAPGLVGKDPPAPVPVAPPYIALKYCVKS